MSRNICDLRRVSKAASGKNKLFRNPLALRMAVLISVSVKNSKGLSRLIDLIKIWEKICSILAPPITASLD